VNTKGKEVFKTCICLGLVPGEFLFRFIYEITRDALGGTPRVNPHNPGPSVTVAVVTTPGSTFFNTLATTALDILQSHMSPENFEARTCLLRQVYSPYPDIRINETEDHKICSSFSVEPNVSPISQKNLAFRYMGIADGKTVQIRQRTNLQCHVFRTYSV
jgi:hypothetical protein